MSPDRIFDGTPASMQDILESRSLRRERQTALLSVGAACIISFTLNIPGPMKQFTLARRAFDVGLRQIHADLPHSITMEQLTDSNTGCEALLAVDAAPEAVKKALVAIEDCHPLGRLFDMDVLRNDGVPVSRRELAMAPRPCLICGQDAKICGRSRAHVTETLQLRVAQILNDFFLGEAADSCAACAVRALLYEVSVTPKPGLVDRANSGSHKDMDFFTFLDSSAALAPRFGEMFRIGWTYGNKEPQQLFRLLRFAGKQAEDAMLQATNGVNTHKGLIFSLGILCCALGAVASRTAYPISMDELLNVCRELGACSLEDFSQPTTADTHGLACYRALRLQGVRGEAAQGFPSAVKIALPALCAAVKDGLSVNDAAAIALIKLIADVRDTNMISRSSPEEADARRQEAARLLQTAPDELIRCLEQLDRDYISRNLSPGGCADLLAIALMLFFLKQQGVIEARDEAIM